MTTGDGILYSTILLILVFLGYKISVANKWKATLKILVPSVLVPLFIFIGWVWYEEVGGGLFKGEPEFLTSIQNITVGMPMVDVILLKGAPDSSGDSSSYDSSGDINDSSYKFYNFSYGSGNLYVRSNELDIVSMVCSSYDSDTRSRTKEVVISELGEPSDFSINASGTKQFLNFITPTDDYVSIEFYQNKASAVCLSHDPLKYIEEYQAP